MAKSRQTHPLRLPGIQDVVFERLAGTFNVYLYGISPDVPASLLAMAQALIDRSTAYPLSGTALAPDLIGITLSTTLTLSGSLSSSDQASVVAAAQSAAADYINNLAIGETLVLNEIADRIRSSDPRIFDVGRPNQPLEEVYLWRSRADVGDVSAEIHSSLMAGIPGFPRVPRPELASSRIAAAFSSPAARNPRRRINLWQRSARSKKPSPRPWLARAPGLVPGSEEWRGNPLGCSRKCLRKTLILGPARDGAFESFEPVDIGGG